MAASPVLCSEEMSASLCTSVSTTSGATVKRFTEHDGALAIFWL